MLDKIRIRSNQAKTKANAEAFKPAAIPQKPTTEEDLDALMLEFGFEDEGKKKGNQSGGGNATSGGGGGGSKKKKGKGKK